MNIKFGVFWKQNLGTIYKDNSITTLGKEADVDLNLSEVSSIHANFKVDGKNYTSIVYIVDIEKGLIRIPFTREVLSIGIHELELVAVMKNGDVIPSQTFTYNIVESLDNLEDITEETNYPILIQLLQDVNSKIAEIDDAIARIPSPEELKGEKGDKGDKGEQGIQGERGLQGIQGIRGEKGDKGDRGLQGIQGVKGEKGDKGERGERGLQGIQGNQGARGIQGEKGDKGETGVGLGFEWSGTRLGIKKDTDTSYKYVELKGAKGEQGAKGEKGDTPSIAHLEVQVANKSKELDTKFNTLTAKQQQDAEVVTARDGEVSLNARLERDLAKGKIHFVDVEGSNVSTESEEGYLENVEILGNTWQNAENLSDIRSVGTKVEGQELYEIPVLSCGKNLFNSELEKGSIDSSSGQNIVNENCIRSVNYIRVFSGRDYVSNLPLIVSEYDTNKKHIQTLSWNNNVYNPSSNCSFIRFRRPNGNTDLNEKIQIEEGTQATPYEPYQEDKLTILSPTPLEKVGKVADCIICKDGVYGVEKNIGNIVLDGSVLPKLAVQHSNRADLCYVEFNAFDNEMVSNSNTVFADGFIDMKAFSRNTTDDRVCAYGSCVTYTMQKLRFLIPISDLSSVHPNGVAEFFKNNPTVVRYQATQPTFIPLPHDQQIVLRTFANKTHISFDTEIQPTIKAQVPKSLGATVNTHTTQIDNLNKELDRVKKLEESSISTITSNKAFTTVAETSGGYFEDVKIEGRTLVNLFNYKDLTHRDVDNRKSTEIANGIRVNNISGYYVDPVFKNDIPIKPNTTYTLFWDYKDIQNSLNTRISIGYRTPISSYSRDILSVDSSLGKVTFTTESIFTDEIGLNFRFVRVPQATTIEVIAEYTNIILLEGDHTDKDITFFEGLKSVGQDTDEISVLSVNNDYFNYYLGKEPTKTYFRLNEYITTGAVIKNISQNPIKCLAYKNGVWDKDVYLRKNEVYVVETEYDVRSITIATGDNWNISKDYFLSDIVEISVYKQDKKQVLYYNSTTQTWEKPILREWDSIEKHSDGKYYYHKRSGEVLLDGSENWYYSNSLDSTKPNYFIHHDPSLISKSMNVGFCNNFIIENPYSFYENCVGIAPNGSARIRHNDYNNDLDGFKTWLQANPTTVVYQLAKEEVYECTNLDLITYSGETNLIANSGTIQPRLKLKVLSNVSNVVKLLQEKVSILENKFIEGLKQVLAGDMMSLAHLLYPEDFENNHEIQTLEL